jgi:hypothetical protein
MEKTTLKDWDRLKDSIKEEGIEYYFKHYSDWEEIEDEKFHELRLKLLESISELERYVEEQYLNYDDGVEWLTIPPQK